MVPEEHKQSEAETALENMSYKLGVYGPATKEVVRFLYEMGFDAIFTEPRENYVRNAREAGLKVYASLWTFKIPHDARRLGVENVVGERLLWASAGCPNNPEVRENSRRMVEHAVSLDVDGVVLDGVRFPSPGSGMDAFLSCFCPFCAEKAREYGCDLGSIKECLREFRKNFKALLGSVAEGVGFSQLPSGCEGFDDWLEFRASSIVEAVEELRREARSVNPDVEVGAALFAPGLSLLVGQDYKGLSGVLDFVQPMVYHRGDGVACINYELASLAEAWADEGERSAVLDKLYGLLGYSEYAPSLEVSRLVEDGLPQEVVGVEVERAAKLVGGGVLTPVLWVVGLTAEEVESLVRLSSSLAVGGLVFFNYQESLLQLGIPNLLRCE